MLLPITETLPQGDAIDALDAGGAIAMMMAGQHAAISSVEGATQTLLAGAEAMATAIRSDHALVYVAAGSSGLMALADASELHGTFGIPSRAVKIHMAGGVPSDGVMPGNAEDGVDIAQLDIRSGDAVIVISASGTTPYALAAAQYAKRCGCTVIGIANNPDTELLTLADIPVCLPTPPEVIAGSTRLGAGTAQKIALNIMSSMMGVKLGHVYCGLMVNVVADNAKLVARAAGIVSQISNVTIEAAKAALAQSGGNAKLAILIASGGTLARSTELLEQNSGHLGPCLAKLKTNSSKIMQN